MFRALRRFIPDTPLPSFRDALSTAAASGIAVLLTGLLSAWLAPAGMALVLVASMGASAIIMLTLPSSPLAQPWPVIGGQLISFAIGIGMARWIQWPLLAGGIAVLLAAFAMQRLHCLHPPGGAAALIPILAHPQAQYFSYSYLLVPVAINVFSLLVLVWGLNYLLGRPYPNRSSLPSVNTHGTSDALPSARAGVSEDDVLAVLAEEPSMPDIGPAELRRLLVRAEDAAIHRVFGELDCAALMSREVVSVSARQWAGEAWRRLRQHKLKTLPVLNDAGQLVGMVALVDFLKHIPLEDLQTDMHALTAWLSGASSREPLVEEVMTPVVQTARPDQPLLDLVPILSDLGFHRLPVVDQDGRLVGMITQSDLIAGLHSELTRQALQPHR